MSTQLERRGALALIVLGYLVLATLYAIRVPAWNAPDEPAHYNYVRSLAVDHRLPVLQPGDYSQSEIDRLTSLKFPPGESIAAFRYESIQPPLYYVIATPVFLVTQPLGERGQVVALRLVTVVIGALFLLAVYRLGRQIFPSSTALPLAATAFVAFIPEHLFMDAAIDNDALAELMLGLTLVVLVDDLARRGAPRNDLLAGLIVGLAVLTKLVAGVSAPLVVLGFFGSAWLASDRSAALRRLPLRLVRAGVMALLVSGWWVARNVVIYGWRDPFGLRRHAQVVAGQPLTGGLSFSLIRQMTLTLFHSFWGQFGWMGIPFADRTYDVIATGCVVVAVGIVAFLGQSWRGKEKAGPTALVPKELRRWLLALLLAEVILVGLGVVFYNLEYLQPQGRYLFPTLPVVGVLAAAGVAEVFRDRYVGLALVLFGLGLGWLSVFSLFQVIGPAFAS